MIRNKIHTLVSPRKRKKSRKTTAKCWSQNLFITLLELRKKTKSLSWKTNNKIRGKKIFLNFDHQIRRTNKNQDLLVSRDCYLHTFRAGLQIQIRPTTLTNCLTPLQIMAIIKEQFQNNRTKSQMHQGWQTIITWICSIGPVRICQPYV